MTILLSRVGVECCAYPVLAIQLKLLLQQKPEGEPTVAQTSRLPQLKSILEQTPAWRHKFTSFLATSLVETYSKGVLVLGETEEGFEPVASLTRVRDCLVMTWQ